MSTAEEIHAWLKSKRDYRQGVLLYQKHGQHAHLKTVMASKAMPGKLLHEMEKLGLKYPLRSGKKNPAPGKENKVSEKKPVVKQNADATVKSQDNRQVDAPWRKVRPIDPQEVKDLKNQFKTLMDERRAHHIGLDKDKPAEVNGKAAIRILSIKGELDIIDDKLKYFEEHGSLPVPVIETEADLSDRASIQRRVEQLKVYIRRYAPGKAKANPARHEQYKNELQMLENILNGKAE